MIKEHLSNSYNIFQELWTIPKEGLGNSLGIPEEYQKDSLGKEYVRNTEGLHEEYMMNT